MLTIRRPDWQAVSISQPAQFQLQFFTSTIKHSPLNINNSLSLSYPHPSIFRRSGSRVLHNSSQFNSVTNLNRFTVTSYPHPSTDRRRKSRPCNITSHNPIVKILNNGIGRYRDRDPRRGRIDEKRKSLNIFKRYVLTITNNPIQSLSLMISNSIQSALSTPNNNIQFVLLIDSNNIQFVLVIHSGSIFFPERTTII